MVLQLMVVYLSKANCCRRMNSGLRSNFKPLIKALQRTQMWQPQEQACWAGCSRRPFPMQRHQQAKSPHSVKSPQLSQHSLFYEWRGNSLESVLKIRGGHFKLDIFPRFISSKIGTNYVYIRPKLIYYHSGRAPTLLVHHLQLVSSKGLSPLITNFRFCL